MAIADQKALKRLEARFERLLWEKAKVTPGMKVENIAFSSEEKKWNVGVVSTQKPNIRQLDDDGDMIEIKIRHGNKFTWCLTWTVGKDVNRRRLSPLTTTLLDDIET